MEPRHEEAVTRLAASLLLPSPPRHGGGRGAVLAAVLCRPPSRSTNFFPRWPVDVRKHRRPGLAVHIKRVVPGGKRLALTSSNQSEKATTQPAVPNYSRCQSPKDLGESPSANRQSCCRLDALGAPHRAIHFFKPGNEPSPTTSEVSIGTPLACGSDWWAWWTAL